MKRFFTSEREVVNDAVAMEINPIELREKAIKLGEQAAKETDTGKKNELLMAKQAIDNLVDIHAVGKDVLIEPETYIRDIKANENLTEGEKVFFINKINEFVKDNDFRSRQAEAVVDDVKLLEDKIRSVDEDMTLSKEIREAKKKPIIEEAERLKKRLEDIYKQPLITVKDAAKEKTVEPTGEAEKAKEAAPVRELLSEAEANELRTLEEIVVEKQTPEQQQRITELKAKKAQAEVLKTITDEKAKETEEAKAPEVLKEAGPETPEAAVKPLTPEEDAKRTGTEAQAPGGEKASGVEQETQAGLRVRQPEKDGMVSESGEKIVPPEPPKEGALPTEGGPPSFEKERQLVKRIKDGDFVSPETKELIKEGKYLPKSIKATKEQAENLIKEVGYDQAENLIRDQKDVPLDVREAVGAELITYYDRIGTEAAKEGKVKEAQEAFDKSASMIDFMGVESTETGRGLRFLREVFSKQSPEGMKNTIRRDLGKAGIELTPEDIKFIDDLISNINKLPDDSIQRTHATIALLNWVAKKRGIKKGDIGWSLWYASILSGYSTQEVNILSNMQNIGAELLAIGMYSPRALPFALRGIAKGFGQYTPEFANTMKTGIEKIKGEKIEAENVLELIDFSGGKWNPLNYYKYVRRFMAAIDVLGWGTAKEMKAFATAYTLAKNQGFTGKKLTAEVEWVLENSDKKMAQYKSQATSEGLSGRMFSLRVNELMEQGRDKDFERDNQSFAGEATFNFDPKGVIGTFVKNIKRQTDDTKILKFIVPFTRIVGSVTNMSIDYTPYGFKRAWKGYTAEADYNRKVNQDEYRRRMAKATLGTLIMGGTYALAKSLEDDDKPWFDIVGGGTGDFRKDQELMASGWKKHSLKIGDRYYSYQYTPLAIGLSIVGNMRDAEKYRKMEEKELLTRLTMATFLASKTVTEMSFLNGMFQFMEAWNQRDPEKTASYFKRFAANTATSVIPNLVKQIDKLFDPTVYDANTLTEYMLKNIPIARGALLPKINVLGEDVGTDEGISDRLLFNLTSKQKADPVWQFIVKNKAWVSVPSKSMTVWDNKLKAERQIEPDEYYGYIKESGKRIKQRIKNELLNISAQEIMRERPDWVDRSIPEIVSGIASEERLAVKNEMFPVLEQDIPDLDQYERESLKKIEKAKKF